VKHGCESHHGSDSNRADPAAAGSPHSQRAIFNFQLSNAEFGTLLLALFYRHSFFLIGTLLSSSALFYL